jgi:tRNA(fMet)-specific endonuclease VapC
MGEQKLQGLGDFVARFLVIPFDIELTKVWARVSVAAERIGRRLDGGDAWIAATAVHYRLPLYTEDDDFLGLSITGLKIISSRPP